MIAAAQPTPDDTAMAPVGQFIRQAPHSMQFPRRAMIAFRLASVKTACGQTSSHRPQPLQRA